MGDFGLARDIYRNDYYRMEMDGKVPFKWMSPGTASLTCACNPRASFDDVIFLALAFPFLSRFFPTFVHLFYRILDGPHVDDQGRRVEFGVLVWEIMSLGQQPYPARTNHEVLQFLKDGGRLEKPENCPDDV